MKEITVRNLQRSVPVDLAGLEKFAVKALKECLKLRRGKASELTKLREVSVLLVSDRRMSQLHRQFLHQRGPTDVLTFEHGEIFISIPTAKRNLHGFDDRAERRAREMKDIQARVLARLA